MRLEIEYRGRKNTVFTVRDVAGRAPAMEFLERLKRTDAHSQRALLRRYTSYGDYGPSMNVAFSRPIKGHGNLFEFKSHQGDRLLYFMLPGGDIALASGFHKGAPPAPEFERAARYREAVLKQDKGKGLP